MTSEIIIHKCEQCDILIEPTVWTDRKRVVYKRFCSLKCKGRNDYKNRRDYYKNYWLTRPNLFAWKKKERVCEVCEVKYFPKGPQAKTCSKKCSKRRWKLLNPEANRKINNESTARCRSRDPERYRFYVKNRRHKIRESHGTSKNFSKTFTLKDWEEIKAMSDYKCVMCLKKVKLTIDHIIPLSKGGQHRKENIQALCAPCNSRKRDKI